MKKRLLLWMLICILSLLALCACGEETPPDGGENPPAGQDENLQGLAFELMGDDTYTVSIGQATALSSIEIPATYNGKPVAEIGVGAFKDAAALVSVTVPDSVTFIGNEAFAGCTQLSRVTLGSGVQTVGVSAFNGCARLCEIVIPDSVTEIRTSAFRNCVSLKSAALGDGLKTLGRLAFADCTALEKVSIGGGLEAISQRAFEGCSALALVEVKDINAFAAIAFADVSANPLSLAGKLACGGEEVAALTLNAPVIADRAFYGCTGITSLSLSDAVLSVGENAFFGCSALSEVSFGTKIASVGADAFAECAAVERVKITDIAAWCKILFTNSASNPLTLAEELHLNDTLVTSLVIPDGVTEIKDYAFKDYKRLMSVFVSDGVKKIGNLAFAGCSGVQVLSVPFVGGGTADTAYLGYIFGGLRYDQNGSVCPRNLHTVTVNGGGAIASHAFYGCASVLSVTLKNAETVGRQAFGYCTGLSSIHLPPTLASVDEGAFLGCDALSKVSITDIAAFCGVDFASAQSNPLSIAKNLYLNGALLTELTVPDGVKGIGDFAFTNAIGITSLSLPEGLESIGESAFYGCEKIAALSLPDSLLTLGKAAFSLCTGLQSVSIGGGLSEIGDSAFAGCEGITALTVGKGVTAIGDAAFQKCRRIETLVLPEGLLTIGKNAFADCYRLKSITLPKSLKSVDSMAFLNLYALEEVHHPDLVAWCGIAFTNENASPLPYADRFYLNGTAVTALTIPAAVETIGNFSFYAAKFLTSVTIEEGVKNIGISAFSSLGSSFRRIVIPDSVLRVENYAFYGCSRLNSITLGKNVQYLGSFAFSRCNNFAAIHIPDSVTAIGESCFEGCSNLTTVTIGSGVKMLMRYTFTNCYRLSNLKLGSSLERIEFAAFQNCTLLEELVIPAKLTAITGSVFADCTGFTSIYYEGTEADWEAKVNVGPSNLDLLNAARYYYSPVAPTEAGNYWCYGPDGSVSVWPSAS